MGKPIDIGNHSFKTKKKAIEFYKQILNSYLEGEQLNSIDFENIFSLLQKHPDFKIKIGTGIKKIVVKNSGYKLNCFHLIRIDGTIEDFSYLKCINGEPSIFSIFSQACRKAVEIDMKNIKQDYFKTHSKNGLVKCQETGILINFEKTHVDHRQPNTFSVIVDRFIELNRIDLESVQYDKIENYGHRLIDKRLEEDFRKYHAEKANLRIVTKEKNLSRTFQAKVNQQKKDLKIE